VLVMGASAALASVLGARLADAGADVALTTATPDAEEAFELRRAGRAVSERNRRVLIEGVDMAIGTGVQVTVRQVAKGLGAIDMLVVAPEIDVSKPAERLTDADWARVLNTNLGGAYYACRAAGREMLNRALPEGHEGPRGRIVIVNAWPAEGASVAAWSANGGLSGLATALEREWSDRGVQVDLLLLDAETRQDADATADAILEMLLAGG
jgi:3-oxoacyl-[acyl-carrier protein] reductase